MPLFQYLYKFLIAFFLLVCFETATAQLFLILLLTVINLIYFAAIRPYIYCPYNIQYNNRIMIHNLIMYSLIVVALLVFNMNLNVLSYVNKILIGDIIAGLVIYSATVNFIYMLVRAQKWYARYMWKPFVFTEIFQENYTLQYWKYK